METNSLTRPVYQLHALNHGVDDLELSIWQLPCEATPHVVKPIRIAGLRGRNMSFVERQVLRRLHVAGISVAPSEGRQQDFFVDEDLALNLGLLFRLLAPMRSAERMRTVAMQMEAMSHPEASYWMGMAMHRKKPRRILCALRIILTDTND